jgi:hypothetical protein
MIKLIVALIDLLNSIAKVLKEIRLLMHGKNADSVN